MSLCLCGSPPCLNDLQVALTSVIICFERLIKDGVCSFSPSFHDPTAVHISATVPRMIVSCSAHTTLSHLDSRKGGRCETAVHRFQFSLQHQSATGLDRYKRIELGLNTPLCAWNVDFRLSSPLTLKTGCPQGCILSPPTVLLFLMIQLNSFAQQKFGQILSCTNIRPSPHSSARQTKKKYSLTPQNDGKQGILVLTSIHKGNPPNLRHPQAGKE